MQLITTALLQTCVAVTFVYTPYTPPRVYFRWCSDCSDYVGLLAGHVSERGHGGADRNLGEALPQRPARVHLGARHQRQAGERVGQQGGVPPTGRYDASVPGIQVSGE